MTDNKCPPLAACMCLWKLDIFIVMLDYSNAYKLEAK